METGAVSKAGSTKSECGTPAPAYARRNTEYGGIIWHIRHDQTIRHDQDVVSYPGIAKHLGSRTEVTVVTDLFRTVRNDNPVLHYAILANLHRTDEHAIGCVNNKSGPQICFWSQVYTGN